MNSRLIRLYKHLISISPEVSTNVLDFLIGVKKSKDRGDF